MAAPEYDYLATEPIYVGGVLGYNIGDPVPADNVKHNGWEKLVQKANKPLKTTAEEPRSVGAASTPPAREDESSQTGTQAKGSGRGASTGK